MDLVTLIIIFSLLAVLGLVIGVVLKVAFWILIAYMLFLGVSFLVTYYRRRKASKSKSS
jgi:hypothetical protein